VTKPDWGLVTAARESGGRLTQSRLAAIVEPARLDAQLAAFAKRGYAFSVTPRGTLVLDKWPRRLFAEEIASDLGTDTVGRKVETHWTVGSTNDLARAEAARGREGTAIFAEEQTAGRGRFGRRWAAPKFSSLLFSLALKSASAAVRPEALALAGAAAVAEAIAQTANLPARIRWPNDVLIEGRKVSGVLVEGLGGSDEGRWFVVGIGVNVNLDLAALPAELQKTAGSISQFLGRDADRALLARAILRRLDFWWEVLVAGETARLAETCRRLSSILGSFITVESEGKRHTGRVVDIDTQYGVVLQLAGGPTRAFAPGETTVIW
jgi:BirA family biotin operon repressor/biotin-[acetyl-CoA-carboxylase] ligase